MLYLHVGTHKTGTSALQTFLTRRPGAMDANGNFAAIRNKDLREHTGYQLEVGAK